MFTTFLLGTFAAVILLMIALLLRPRRTPAGDRPADDRIPYAGLAVLALAALLLVWGLAILG